MHAALSEQGYALADQTTYHDVYSRHADLLVLPKPGPDGNYNADIIDQIIADRWVPISSGRLRGFNGG